MGHKAGDRHFEEGRKEWTRRKHDLLRQYLVPAGTKMKEITKRLALVDGYAGANEYCGESAGSTHIMVELATKLKSSKREIVVYACEPVKERYDALVNQFQKEIDQGLLVAFNQSHQQSVRTIQSRIAGYAAIVFLDPMKVGEMTLDEDIYPWASRKKTDILGVYMATQANRCANAVRKAGVVHELHPSTYLGPQWEAATNLSKTYSVFLDALGAFKKYKGIYRLRKQDLKSDAYGIFGLSDHPDGYWLLSNAVAKDFGKLKDVDYERDRGNNLFADYYNEIRQGKEFQYLVQVVKPIVERHHITNGERLALKVIEDSRGTDRLFGLYTNRDYSEAARHILGITS